MGECLDGRRRAWSVQNPFPTGPPGRAPYLALQSSLGLFAVVNSQRDSREIGQGLWYCMAAAGLIDPIQKNRESQDCLPHGDTRSGFDGPLR